MGSATSKQQRILFFDGVCNLCNFFVAFLIVRDQKQQLFFAPLQGPTARAELGDEITSQLSTVIYYRDGQVLRESSAAIVALSDLGGFWSGMRIFLIFPTPVRDVFYRIVARNRYRWFGQRSTCRLPTAEEKTRFLD